MALTYKEMHDTFTALKKTKDYIDNRWQTIETFFKTSNKFVFVGCGSGYSNAKSFAMICNMSTGMPAMALAAGDILLHTERYKKSISGAAVVFISRSGRTSELIKALNAMKVNGFNIKTASFVCADDTPLGEKSDLVLSTPWAFDESVCQTRCVTNAYYMAAYITAKITGDNSVLKDLNQIITEGSAYIEKAENLAKNYATKSWTHAVVLADAELEGIAEEGALVFKEVCQLPSSYHHLLDVRHGPMVLIGKETLVIVALGTGCELELNLLNDLKEKGAYVIAVTDEPILPADIEEITITRSEQKISHTAKGIPLIILCQMIAYYKSKETSADPDKPTGLNAWISL